MSRTSIIRILLAIVLLVLAVVAFRALRAGKSTLLEQARRIPQTEAISRQTDSYFWLNPDELLYLTPMQQAGSYEVMRRNVTTGDVTKQGDLISSGLRVSPNGHWALTAKSTPKGAFYAIERTDGNREVRYQSLSPDVAASAGWMPDDSAFVELVPTTTIQFKAKNGAIQSRTQAGSLHLYSLDTATPVFSLTTEEDSESLSLLGVLPDHHALITDNFNNFNLTGSRPKSDNVQMIDFPLERNAVGHHFTIRKPDDALDLEAALSPQGDRIAWLYAFIHTPPEFQRLNKLYAWLHVGQSYSAALWLSKPDGSDLHEVGSIANLPNMKDVPTGLRWTTDGSNVSFLFRGALYTTPTTHSADK